MTPAQTKLRQLRDRQSKERGRVAEMAIADELTDETRAELDTIETGTPDLERQMSRRHVGGRDRGNRAARRGRNRQQRWPGHRGPRAAGTPLKGTHGPLRSRGNGKPGR